MRKISENYFLNIYFLNVDISLIIQDPSLNFVMGINNIVVEGTMSQIFDIDPGCFFYKILNKYS